MSNHVPKGSYEKIRNFFDEGYTTAELAIMYNTTEFRITNILDGRKYEN